jgi:hypothetical protein
MSLFDPGEAEASEEAAREGSSAVAIAACLRLTARRIAKIVLRLRCTRMTHCDIAEKVGEKKTLPTDGTRGAATGRRWARGLPQDPPGSGVSGRHEC